MAVGKPVIGAISGSRNNFIKNIRVGFSCEAEDYNALVELISNLDLDKLKELGEYSKKVYKTKYSKDIFISRLMDTIKALIN